MSKSKSKTESFIAKKGILFVVFVSGASLLVLEIIATRIISPYFGNTIFTTTSVIGVVLAALSFGYYFGGIFADRHPKESYFYRLILMSGLSVLFLQIINNLLLPGFVYNFSLKVGPLVVSIILFLIPSFILGMLSPFAIKLHEMKNIKVGIGKLSGEVFFASTLGSILGTFLAGYYLIPTFGIQNIVIGIGLLLSVMGILGTLKGVSFKSFTKTALLLSLFFSLAFFSQSNANGLIYTKDGIYEKLSVIETLYNGKPARVLLQDASSGSAVFTEDRGLAFNYTNYYKLYQVLDNTPTRALFIGGGAYTMPNKMSEELPNIKIDVVEIEPELIEISKKYFGFSNKPNVYNHITDGRRFLHDTGTRYNFIFSDVYSSLYSIPSHFTTVEFFELAKDKLTPDGIFLANIIGDLSRQKDSLLLNEAATFRKVFPESYIFAVESPKSSASQNIIFVGLKNKSNFLEKIAKSNDAFVKEIKGKIINLDRFNLSSFTPLTDDYSPTENLTATLLERIENNPKEFSGDEALAIVSQQLSYGPRHYNSEGINKARMFLESELSALNNVEKQNWEENINGEKYTFNNFISRFNKEKKERILIAAHYDSKKFADRDKIKTANMPGANDSGSGVGVLLELASVLSNTPVKPNIGIDLVFFDGEEGIENANWYPIGSTYFAKNLKVFYEEELPQEAIVIDMICDKNLEIAVEENSLKAPNSNSKKIFELATKLYPRNFTKEMKYNIQDDHIPLINAGIPSTLLIDFDYPYFHTTEDTLDKCSFDSLDKVGEVLLEYIYSL